MTGITSITTGIGCWRSLLNFAVNTLIPGL
jgi:hypothetical protein